MKKYIDPRSCCRVCGYYYPNYFPWGEDGECATYNICVCYGVEFGNEDYILSSISDYRKKWINAGCPWFYPEYRPLNWSFEEQKKQLPEIPEKYHE